MSAIVVSGKTLAESIKAEVRTGVSDFIKTHARAPFINLILVGEREDSVRYVASKERLALSLGMEARISKYPGDVSETFLIEEIQKLNNSDNVDAILLQLPLPSGLDAEGILSTISCIKDVDGLHPHILGELFIGSENKYQLPCTPHGVLRLIDESLSQLGRGTDLSGLNAVVVGRSNLVGKPTALLLEKRNASVSICHSRTKNLEGFLKCADIVVSATGVASLIKGGMLKVGAVVIDVGINYVDGSMVGDCEFESCKSVAGAITPVPGGVGPMTMAMLMENVLICAKNNIKEK